MKDTREVPFPLVVAGGFLLIALSLLAGWTWLMAGQMKPGQVAAIATDYPLTNTVEAITEQPPLPSPWPTFTPTDVPAVVMIEKPTHTEAPPRPTLTPRPSAKPKPTADLAAIAVVDQMNHARRAMWLSDMKEFFIILIGGSAAVGLIWMGMVWTSIKVIVWGRAYLDGRPDAFEQEVLDLCDDGYTITAIVQHYQPNNISGGGDLFVKVKGILVKHGRIPNHPPTPPLGASPSNLYQSK